ncbi:MAG: glutamine synthetase family protein, partial [Thermofilaceae archaeon]
MPTVEPLDVWRILKGAGVKRVLYIVADITGKPRGVSFHIDEAKRAFKEGVPFDGSSVPSYARVHESDVLAEPDPSAVYVEPWRRTAWVFCRIADPPSAAARDPRLLLERAVDKLRANGYAATIGIEVEFFLVRVEGGRVVPADEGCYFDVQQPPLKVVERIEAAARRAGLGGSKVHHEVAPGQYEYNLPPLDPMRAADSFLFLKHIASTVAGAHGLRATFMPKPFWGVNGSGAHVHLSLRALGENANGGNGSMEEIGVRCLAGVLKYSKPLAAVAAPTVNSYKRLVPHHEAPTRLVWGYANRSALVRVPRYGSSIARIEVREPDPLMNPYLTLALLLTSALKGLEEGGEPPEPLAASAYDVPGTEETPPNLQAALQEFERASHELEVPGELASAYLEVKKREWREYIEAAGPWEKTWNLITDWEYKKYL